MRHWGEFIRGSAVMIVCSCNVLSDHDVRAAIDGGAARRRPREVYRSLCGGFPCGRCICTIRDIMSPGETAPALGGADQADASCR